LEKVISRDGTPIAYHRRGAGPPLVLVHGTGAASALAWTAVLPALEERFSIYAVERRGRGESGDGSSYAIEREFEDIAAVVHATGAPANLLGHSYGALCALGAALLISDLRKLVLYEPAMPAPGAALHSTDFTDRLQALLEAGDREGLLIAHYSQDAGLTPEQIEQFKSSPLWPKRPASAHTVPRELRAEVRFAFDAERFKDMHTPTLLLLGGDSPPVVRESAEAVHAALPNSRIAVMQGQQHIAMYTGPDLFLREVLRFLADPS
jgi:pimeloyl-ACP methyl ester carboxylesterase